MVAGVVVLVAASHVAASHDAQRRRYGALTRGQDRAHQQQLSLLPGRVGEQRREGREYRYNDIGQSEHGRAFPWKVGLGHLTLFFYFSKNAQSPAKSLS